MLGFVPQPNLRAAASYSRLGIHYRLLGDLEQAEKYLLQGLEVFESLNVAEVYIIYSNLAKIAHARGDAEAAARWQAKRDAKVAELERRRQAG